VETTAFHEFDELLVARHSCRAFLPTEIPRETVTKIITAAQKVPSWCNAQPWQVLVTSRPETDRFRTALEAAAITTAPAPDIAFPARYKGAYQDRRRTCGWQLYQSVGIEKGDRAASGRQMLENFRLFGAPHVAIVTTPVDLGAYGVLDCGAFVTGFMLAARALGVASIAEASVAGFSALVHRHFDIPPDRQIVCAISFGLEDEVHPANHFRTPRADIAEVMDWR